MVALVPVTLVLLTLDREATPKSKPVRSGGAAAASNPILGQTVVTTALPAVALVVMLAVQYRVAIPETASALLISTLGSILTLSVFIYFLL